MPSDSQPLSLVVTADDFGIGVQTSRGIIQAHLQGPVTATSVMVVTGKHIEDSVPLLADAPRLDLGLHLVLTQAGHRPLVAKKSSGLIDRQGNFLSNRRLWIRSLLGRLNAAGVAEEIAAQAELFQKLIGRRPDYVDGHHHAHQLPAIRQALASLVRTIRTLPGITRITREPPEIRKNVPTSRSRRRAANYLGNQAGPYFSERGVWANDFYFGMISDEDLKSPFPWEVYLRNLPQIGVVEWVVHPGLEDATLTGRDSYIKQRPVELGALTGKDGVAKWEFLRGRLARKSALAAKK
jgi:predicted glycoside hydrolase/deacetylase ChbG (UPF0249 family)